jgi:hypothetical protein
MGLVFQYAVSSDVIAGVGRDAAHIARHIATREAEGRASLPHRSSIAA